MQKTISKLFTEHVYVDLDKDSCICEFDNVQKRQVSRFSQYLTFYLENMVYSEDVETFKYKCSKEYIQSKLCDENDFYYFDYRRKDNDKYYWNRVHVIAEALNQNNQPEKIILANMNIDEIKEHEYASQQEIVRVSQAKSDFLSSVSHDLRTSMNTIMGLIAVLEHDIEKPDKIHNNIRKLQASGRYMLSVLNDVLDMNKIENRIVSINNAEFELSSFLDDLNVLMLQLTEEKKQNFRMELINVKDNWLVGDKDHLSKILMNVLSNSVKYTPESGDIQLIITQSDNDEKAEFKFVIKDNGMGMEKAFVDRIFEPFVREDNRIPAQISGTGLGMAIVKNLVELLDGDIKVESETDKGTTFTITIDFETVQKECVSLVEEDNFEESNDLRGMSFLIAEDNEINSCIIEELMGYEGAKVTICNDGKSVVDKFINSPPYTFDMILMDIRMPQMNGYEAAKAIRNSNVSGADKVPILAMTANVFLEDIELAINSGMNGHIPKPIDFEVLKSTIKKNKYIK